MKKPHRLLQALVAVAGILLSLTAADAFAQSARKDMVLKGDAKCTRCHDESEEYPVLAIGKTRHGTTADGRTPSCTSCHGESDRHVNKPEGVKERPHPDVVFKRGKSSPEAQNGACLTCHESQARRSHWATSTHAQRDVTCSSCHEVHTGHDKVRDRRTQFEVCFTCHKDKRTEVGKPSHHPVLEGKVSCSDCHNPHGSVSATAMLKRDSVNEVCYSCHMEKRGPFVHNHEPVSENCSNCHNPHGTTAENMLKARPPFLCHQCHTPHGPQVGQILGQGQTTAQLSGVTSGKSGINYFMARGCVNCHTQVHGSNNPSATNPTPQFMFR